MHELELKPNSAELSSSPSLVYFLHYSKDQTNITGTHIQKFDIRIEAFTGRVRFSQNLITKGLKSYYL